MPGVVICNVIDRNAFGLLKKTVGNSIKQP